MESGNLKLPGHKVGVGSSCGPNLEDPLNNCFGFGIGIGSNQNNHHAITNNITSSTTTTSSSTPPLNYEIGLMVSNSSSASTTSHKSCDEQSHNNNNNNNNNLINNDNNIMSSTCSSSNNINMVHDLASLIPNWTHNNHSSSSYDIMQIPKHISQSFPKFTELLNSPSSTNLDDYNHFLLNNNNKDHHNHHNHHLFSALSSRCQIINGRDHHHHRDDDEDDDEITIPGGAGLFNGHYSNDDNRGQFSHIHSSVNISNYLNGNNISNCHQYYNSMMRPSGLMDHFAQPQPGLNDNVGLAVFGSGNSFGLVVDDPIQQPHDRFSCSRNTQRISSLSSEMREIEKQSIMERRSSNQLATPIKKSRLESRAPSCPPFKVRKEKLGDRIAALQQLVSPFGKTDTASVLMEAIGYIKFLQNQVETLSVPYMKSIRHKSIKAMQRGVKDEESYVEEPTKRDLRSRGLCLVPLSCMSYVTAGDQGGGATIWPPPPTFGGTSFY